MQQERNVSSVLTIEQRKKITMTGVQSVDSFTDALIRLTVNGEKVLINGSNLTVLTFSQGSGNFIATGNIDSVKFAGKKLTGLFQ